MKQKSHANKIELSSSTTIGKKWDNAVFIYPAKKPEMFDIYNIVPPVGIEYIATAVKDLLKNFVILDGRYEEKDLTEYFNEAEVIGFSVIWSFQVEYALELMNKIPPGITVIWGGPTATARAEDLMKKHKRIDIIVQGDGEEAAREIFSGKPLSEINGIIFRKGSKVIATQPQKSGKKLEIYPDRTLRKYKYESYVPPGFGIAFDTVMTSRGCNFACEFCSVRFDALGKVRKWTSRTPENVVAELKEIRAKLVLIADDDFTADKDRVEKICDLIIEQKIKKLFLIESRIEIGYYPGIVEKMWKAGFRFIIFGIESAQDKTLKRIGKGFSRKKAVQALQTIGRYPFITAGFFIVGYLGETRRDMMEIIPFARNLGLDFLQNSKLRVLDNTRMLKAVEETPGFYVDGDGWVYSDEMSRNEVRQLARNIRRSYYNLSHIMRLILKLIKSGLLLNSTFYSALWGVFIGDVLSKKLKKNLVKLK